MKHYSEFITINSDVRFGKPCIRGVRTTVFDILNWLASGMSNLDIIQDYPELNEDDIKAALAYATDREHRIRFAL